MSVGRVGRASGTRAFIYVQHLLGIGHLKRAATLAQAMALEGLAVTLASVRQLPGIREVTGDLSTQVLRRQRRTVWLSAGLMLVFVILSSLPITMTMG